MATENSVEWPLPDVSSVDKPFWDEVQKGNLVLQKCQDCGRLQFLPRPVCINCFSRNLGWQQSKGTGAVYSFTEVFVPVRPGPRKYVEESGVPILFAAIDLDEGVRAMGEVVECKPDELKIGSRVQVKFEKAPGANFNLPKFRLIKE
jgi:uncharacterized OB-fold protein